MFYIFTCHELDIIRKAVKVSHNDDIFELMEKLKNLNLTLKEYFDSLSEDKVLEANSFEALSDTHIITKFEDKIKDNHIEFNTTFSINGKEIDILEKNHYLVISKKQLNSLKKIPFIIKYVNDNNNVVKENRLLYCYEADYNKDSQCFVIKSQCWFNKYFNFFKFDNTKDYHLTRFLRESLSFNHNVLSSGYNMEINNFYEEKIIELKDHIALTSYCRNTNKDMSKYLDIAKNKYSNEEYIKFLSHILKYNIGNIYDNTSFEGKTCIEIFKDILLDDKELRYGVFKNIFDLDYLYSINKIVNFFNTLFNDEKSIKEEELKELNSKKKKKTSKSNKKKNSNSLNLGYDISKSCIECILNTIIDLYGDIIYDKYDKDKYVNILENLEKTEEVIEDVEKEDPSIITEESIDSIQIGLLDDYVEDKKANDKDKKKKDKNMDSQLSLF